MARLGETVPSAEMSSIKAGSTLKELLFEVANMMSEAIVSSSATPAAVFPLPPFQKIFPLNARTPFSSSAYDL